MAKKVELPDAEAQGDLIDHDAVADDKQLKKHWGHQYDLWLIRKAQRKNVVGFIFDFDLNGITKGEVVNAVPLRIDQDAIQIKAEGSDEAVWVMKRCIRAFKEIE